MIRPFVTACTLLVAIATCLPGQSVPVASPIEIYRAKVRSAEMFASGRMDSALVLLRQVAPLDSSDAYLWRRYGRAAAAAGSYAEAARALEHAYGLGVFLPANTAVEIARAHLRQGHHSAALDWLERASRNRQARTFQIGSDTAWTVLRDSARFRAMHPQISGSVSREERWHADVDYFVREAQRLHVHPERPAYSRAFADSANALKARTSRSSDLQMMVGLQKLSAMLRDGHTGVRLGANEGVRMLPVELYVFKDGVFVVGGSGGATAAIGHKLVAINKRPIEQVVKAAAAYIPRDNPMGILAWLPHTLVTLPYLQDMGVADGSGSATFTLEDRNGKRYDLQLIAGELRHSEGIPQPPPGTPTPLYLSKRDPYWTQELPHMRALYLSFNAVADAQPANLKTFSEQLSRTLNAGTYDNLIVDVRNNGGGNSFLLTPLFQTITAFKVARPNSRVFVITSRHTFSAAQNFVSKLEWLVDPIFVGEPTGSAPNFVGEVSPTRLPYSNLMVVFSNRLHMNADWEDQRQWIAPHIPAPLTSSDFFAGRDPAMSAIEALIRS